MVDVSTPLGHHFYRLASGGRKAVYDNDDGIVGRGRPAADIDTYHIAVEHGHSCLRQPVCLEAACRTGMEHRLDDGHFAKRCKPVDFALQRDGGRVGGRAHAFHGHGVEYRGSH